MPTPIDLKHLATQLNLDELIELNARVGLHKQLEVGLKVLTEHEGELELGTLDRWEALEDERVQPDKLANSVNIWMSTCDFSFNVALKVVELAREYTTQHPVYVNEQGSIIRIGKQYATGFWMVSIKASGDDAWGSYDMPYEDIHDSWPNAVLV